jgi:hypothetical protein
MDETTENTTVTTEESEAGETPSPDLAAEVAKWKALSRTNEARWKDASRELDQLRQAQMSEADRALEQARNETRTATLAEVGGRLAAAELRAHAATAGVELPPADYLNLGAFIGEDGSPNADAIASFVTSLPKPATEPEFPQGIGLGRQGGTSNPHQLTREEYLRLSREDRIKARKDGRIEALMRGEL